jgi:hypothetical protein
LKKDKTRNNFEKATKRDSFHSNVSGNLANHLISSTLIIRYDSIRVPDCFQKWGGLKFGRKPRNFARKCLHMTFWHIWNRKHKNMHFLRDFLCRKCFYWTFWQKNGKNNLKTRFLPEFTMELSNFGRKFFQNLAESQTSFQICGGLDPPSPPLIGKPVPCKWYLPIWTEMDWLMWSPPTGIHLLWAFYSIKAIAMGHNFYWFSILHIRLPPGIFRLLF